MRDFYVGFYSVAILEFPTLISLVYFNNRVNLVFKYTQPKFKFHGGMYKAPKEKIVEEAVIVQISTTIIISNNPPLLFTSLPLLLLITIQSAPLSMLPPSCVATYATCHNIHHHTTVITKSLPLPLPSSLKRLYYSNF